MRKSKLPRRVVCVNVGRSWRITITIRVEREGLYEAVAYAFDTDHYRPWGVRTQEDVYDILRWFHEDESGICPLAETDEKFQDAMKIVDRLFPLKQKKEKHGHT